MVFILLKRRRYRFIFAILVLADLAYLLIEGLTLKFFDSPKCFIDHSSLNYSYEKLEDILLSSEKPPLGSTIFFIDSKCKRFKQSAITSIKNKLFPQPVNVAYLTDRQACVIESAALHNPNYMVFILFTTPSYFEKFKSKKKDVMNVLKSYPNIRFRNVDLWTYTANTPVHDWFLEGEIFQSSYIIEHMSDFLRLLTIWRWGGLYLDLDAFTLRSMESLPPNYVGIEPRFHHLGNSVLNFSPKDFGHEVATIFLEDFVKNYDGNDWAKNGPRLITRVINKICGTNETKLMMNNPYRCSGINVLPPTAFYAIDWNHWTDFFVSEFLEDMMKILEPSYVAHIWNHLTNNLLTEKGSNSTLDIIAKENCPYVYRLSGKFI